MIACFSGPHDSTLSSQRFFSVSDLCFHRRMRRESSLAPMDGPPQKRAKFSLAAGQKLLASKGRLPDLNKLVAIVKESPAPQNVLEKFCGVANFIGIDVETHARARYGECDWRTDEFGLLTGASEETLSSLRIIQLGWAYFAEGGMVTKTKLIKPSGFTIDPGATDVHRISHEEASGNGIPIQDALREFFEDVVDLRDKGYRLCAHHLGFDAGIILRELERAGLHGCMPEWVSLVGKGLCTMDTTICHWVRQQIGLWDVPRKIPMRLKDAVMHILPSHADMLQKHHNAGNDAHLHVLLAQELHRRANLRCSEMASQSTRG